jgi:hypothetical protein
LLENQPRNATIVTTVPTLFLVLDRHDYITLLKEWQDIQLREKVDFLSVRNFTAQHSTALHCNAMQMTL